MTKHLPISTRHAPDVQQRQREFDAWDDEQRRRDGFWAGLALRFPKGNLHLSRHWPHLLCWQWIFSWQPAHRGSRRLFQVWKMGPGAAGGLHLGVRLLWLGQFVYQRQASDRIGSFSVVGKTAPEVFERRLRVANGDDY